MSLLVWFGTPFCPTDRAKEIQPPFSPMSNEQLPFIAAMLSSRTCLIALVAF